MLSITYHFRASSRPNGGDGRIFARLIYNRQSGNITLPYRIHLSEWDQTAKEPVYLSPGHPRTFYLEQIREEMNVLRQELVDLVHEFDKKEEFYTVTQMLNCYRFRRQGKGLSEWVQILSNELIEAGCFRTARAYRTTLNSLLDFCGKKELYADNLTEKLILGYERSLKERKRSLNTISFYMRNLRAICNKGIKRGMFDLPAGKLFARVYTKVAVSRKRALTKKEMKSLENLLQDPVTPTEEKNALRLFMFAFHARGMSFVDLAYLKKEDTDMNAGKLSYFRRKTGQFIEMQLNSPMRGLINYFLKTNPESPYLFPIIQDQSKSVYLQYCTGLRRQNERLKYLAVRAKLGKGLSTHQARHAWATIAKNENIPVWVISEGLGHTSVATTYIYLDSFGSSVLDRAHRKVSRAVTCVD